MKIKELLELIEKWNEYLDKMLEQAIVKKKSNIIYDALADIMTEWNSIDGKNEIVIERYCNWISQACDEYYRAWRLELTKN